jgi:hypothetical protein
MGPPWTLASYRGKARRIGPTYEFFFLCEKTNDFRGKKWRFRGENGVVTF